MRTQRRNIEDKKLAHQGTKKDVSSRKACGHDYFAYKEEDYISLAILKPEFTASPRPPCHPTFYQSISSHRFLNKSFILTFQNFSESLGANNPNLNIRDYFKITLKHVFLL